MDKRHPNPKVRSLLAKLDRLYAELKSDEHYESTPSVAYGTHHPLEVPLTPCEACSRKPCMKRVQETPARWLAVCECERSAKSVRKKEWQAALEWNGINLANKDYRDLPLFGLAKLGPVEAHERLVGFRRNLELRKNIAQIEGDVARLTERSIGIEQPGKGYTEKLEAYLAWCLWALRLTKLAKQQEKNH